MSEPIDVGPHGPLASVIEVRRGPDDAHTGGLEHREALIYTLGKADFKDALARSKTFVDELGNYVAKATR